MSLVYSVGGVMPLPKLAWDFEGNLIDYIQGVEGVPYGSSLSYTPSGKYMNGLNIPNASSAMTSVNCFSFTTTSTYYTQQAITVTVWVKFTNILSNNQVVQINKNSNHFNIFTRVSGIVTCGLPGGVTSETPAALNNGVWYHLVLVANGTNGILYVNGVAQPPSATYTPTTTPTILSGWVGVQSFGTPGTFAPFKGTIDDLRIYNTALTAAQVQAVFNEQGVPGRGVVSIPTPQGISLTGTPLFTQLSQTATASAVGAFSLRAVNGISTKAVQVRNGTTSAIQDFYADQRGNLLTAPIIGQSLANWLAGATGYVTTWYDQSGRGNDAIQNTAANQPIIQRATKGPGYACLFNGANSQVLSCAAGTYSLLNGTKYAVCVTERRNNAAAQGSYFGLGSTGASGTGLIIGYFVSETNIVYTHRGDNLDNTVPAFAGASEPIRYTVYDYSTSTTKRVYINASILPVTNTSYDLAATTGAMTIGKSFGTSNSTYYYGEMYEIIVFTRSLFDLDGTTSITQVYQNQLGAYGA